MLDEFVKNYEKALGTQDWKVVGPLISVKACVTFSDGTVHRGKQAIQLAYEKNFKAIKSEKYSIDNVNWILKTDELAVYLFQYNWSGLMNGKRISGIGVGTAVLEHTIEGWKLLTEHLGRKTN